MIPLICGAGGFLGHNITDELDENGLRYEVINGKRDCNFLDYNKTLNRLSEIKFDTLVNVSSVVGGIQLNGELPATLMYDNTVMALNLIRVAITVGCSKIIQIGTVCSYPRVPDKIPFTEDCLYNGAADYSNRPYGHAKLCIMDYLDACEREFGTKHLTLIPTNMFGRYDNYREDSSHVVPAILRKVAKAKDNNEKFITCFGTGTATRDLLWARDCAKAIVSSLNSTTNEKVINLGTGNEYTIKYIAETICNEMDFDGKIRWDITKPDGQPRRILNIEKAEKELGWKPNTNFITGLKTIISNKWYK